MTQPRHEVSRHRTPRGIVVYARRADGGLQVWLEPRHPQQAQLIADGGPRGEVRADVAPAACA